ncbi:MAG: DUF1952 domain-containing protein [Ardenticatenaceae bacterium]|nr:DUF1952 domain-containing protein [Ardenticatenaceae bacterium]
MAEVKREVRGVPRWLIGEYLEELGARAQDDGWLHGAGWAARLALMDDYRIGSLRVGRVQLELAGDDDAVAGVWAVLEKKLLRAGG